MRLLLVEDNPTLSKGLIYSLESNNYEVVHEISICNVKKLLDNDTNFDAIILDVSLPDGNGFDFYKDFIKKLKISTVFLTAKDDENDIVYGLNLGADDYITKPFSTKELLARINRIILRNKKESIIYISDIKYDYDKMIIYKDGKEVTLTSLETKLLNLLFNNLNKVVTREYILDKIWDWTGNDVDDHTITVYFKRIREKIDSDIIKTVKGIGYRIDEK